MRQGLCLGAQGAFPRPLRQFGDDYEDFEDEAAWWSKCRDEWTSKNCVEWSNDATIGLEGVGFGLVGSRFISLRSPAKAIYDLAEMLERPVLSALRKLSTSQLAS